MIQSQNICIYAVYIEPLMKGKGETSEIKRDSMQGANTDKYVNSRSMWVTDNETLFAFCMPVNIYMTSTMLA